MTPAADTIARFWAIQDEGRYAELLALFTDDAVFVDPLYGTLTGRDAIGSFLARMERVMAASGTRFELVDAAADGDVGWARWIAHLAGGDVAGYSLYRFRGGLISCDADYLDTLAYERVRAAGGHVS
ncbi:MAG: nuclear transport factor 2 family protein [Acidimicrobiales bacterium]|nr:nuclear transport factor 2 family protein [Acidimicrobiales bacterium]